MRMWARPSGSIASNLGDDKHCESEVVLWAYDSKSLSVLVLNFLKLTWSEGRLLRFRFLT